MTTKSILQTQADNLRKLKASIEGYERIEKDLVVDVERCEIELMRARSNLHDTRYMLNAQRAKLANDANDMHLLIERVVHPQ